MTSQTLSRAPRATGQGMGNGGVSASGRSRSASFHKARHSPIAPSMHLCSSFAHNIRGLFVHTFSMYHHTSLHYRLLHMAILLRVRACCQWMQGLKWVRSLSYFFTHYLALACIVMSSNFASACCFSQPLLHLLLLYIFFDCYLIM